MSASPLRALHAQLGHAATLEASRALGTLADVQFGPDVGALLDRYHAIGPRPRYLWAWAARAIDAVTLSCVPESARAELRDTKVLATVLNTLLDDLADRGGDPQLLEDGIGVLDGGAALVPWHELIADLRDEVWARFDRLPGAGRWRALWRWDWRQVCNAMRWSTLLRVSPELLNRSEWELYAPAGINVKVFATLDFAASPALPAAEIAAVREAVVHAEACAELANNLATWRRELPEGDATSIVIADACSDGVISVAELATVSTEALVARLAAAGSEHRALTRWRRHRAAVTAAAARVHAVDLASLGRGCDLVLGMYLLAAGRV